MQRDRVIYFEYVDWLFVCMSNEIAGRQALNYFNLLRQRSRIIIQQERPAETSLTECNTAAINTCSLMWLQYTPQSTCISLHCRMKFILFNKKYIIRD